MEYPKINKGLLSRISEVNNEKLDPLPPLKRWLRNIQVPSIEEATKGIPIQYIEDDVETAKNYAKRKKIEFPQTNLTVDEIAALILYTLESPTSSGENQKSPTSSGENQSLYFKVNKWLREYDQSETIPFINYLVLLLSGLSKIPPYEGLLYQGVQQDLHTLYQSKKDKKLTVVWNGISSSTTKLDVLKDFLRNSKHRTLFYIHSKTARKISDFSLYQKEEEALFFPHSQFNIDSLFVNGDLTIITLCEVDPIENLISLFSNVTLVQSPSPTKSVGTGILPPSSPLPSKSDVGPGILPLSSPSPSKSDVGTGVIPLTQDKSINLEKKSDIGTGILPPSSPLPSKSDVGTGILPPSSPSPSKSDVGTEVIPPTQDKVRENENFNFLHERWTPLINGDSNRLVRETTFHLQNYPNSFVAYYYRGRANFILCGYKIVDKSDWNQAFTLAKKKLEESPKDVDAYFVIAQCYHYTDEYNKSIQFSSMAIHLNPNYSYAYWSRGYSYYMKDEYDKSIEDCSKAMQLNPNYLYAYGTSGASYMKKGEYDKSIQDCSIAIQLNPNYSFAYFSRGEAYHMKGEYDKSISDYSKAIQLNPDDSDPYRSRGRVYLMKGEYEKSIEDCSKAIQLKPKYSDYGTRGASYRMTGDYDKSIEDCSKAIQTNQYYSYAYGIRGASYCMKGEYQKSIEDCSKAIQLNPNDIFAYGIRGSVYRKMHKTRAAKSDSRSQHNLNLLTQLL